MAGQLTTQQFALRPNQHPGSGNCAVPKLYGNEHEGDVKVQLNPAVASGNAAMDQDDDAIYVDVPTEANSEDVVAIPEARVPKTLKNPELPTTAEWESHCLTHNPYQSWCPVCVEAQGKEDAHRRDGGKDDAENAILTMGMDYGFIG